MTSGVVIVGVGGMGREAAGWWRDHAELNNDVPLVGFVDDDPALEGATVDGVQVWGPLEALDPDSHCALIAIGSSAVREKAHDRVTALGVELAALVHPSVVVGPGVAVGSGSIVGPGVVLTRDVSLGRCSIVNYGAAIGHDGQIGDYAFVGPGAYLAGNVAVGAGAEVGIGANVIQGVSIGAGAIIGAGAVVIRDIPAGVTAIGVPARFGKAR